MNREYQCRRKLVHLDATMCAEMSNTADGSKCLREPMAASARDSRISRGLIPRPSYKSVKSSYDQSFEIPGISEFNCDDAGSSDTGECRQMESCEMDLNSNNSDVVNKSIQPQLSVDFVSAKQYMNPTSSLLNNLVPQKNVVSPEKHCSMLVGKASQKSRSKHIATTQKNLLDRYFKPVSTCKVSCSQSVASHSAGSANCCTTPDNSPHKSVLRSPVAKLPGSDTIYYYSPESKGSTSCDSISSSHCSSAAAVSQSNDDLDFEASFDYIWKTDTQSKRKSAKQASHSSKKTASRVSRTDRDSRKSVDSGSATKDITVADVVQQSSDMSSENYGLFGFSNNTLLALDSDTDFEEDTTDYFSLLPPEVVSNILCRLPFCDLCLNVNRVCLSWKNIIESDEVSYL